MPPVGNEGLSDVFRLATCERIDAANPRVMMCSPSGRKRQYALQQRGAKCHGAPMKLADQQIRPYSSAKFASLSVKGVSDLISVRVDQYRITGDKHQVIIMRKRFQNCFYLFRQP